MTVLTLITTACPTPGQYGGPIPVDSAGLGGRLRSLCAASATVREGCGGAGDMPAAETDLPDAVTTVDDGDSGAPEEPSR